MPKAARPATALPEVSESQSAGQTALVFADIRNCLHVPMVNLIYRHLATVPSALEWAWSSVRPVVVDGTVPTAAPRLTSSMAGLCLPDGVTDTSDSGDPKEIAQIRRVLDSYNVANPQNLIIVLGLLELIGSGRHRDSGVPVATLHPAELAPSGRPAISALPPMIDPGSMAASTLSSPGFDGELVSWFSGVR